MILLIIAGLVFIFFQVKKESKLQSDSNGWPMVEAVVTISQVIRHWDKNAGSPKTHYRVELSYNYLVEGIAYSGKRYSFNKSLVFNNIEGAKKLLREYPLGKKISVYYMPSNPQESVIIL